MYGQKVAMLALPTEIGKSEKRHYQQVDERVYHVYRLQNQRTTTNTCEDGSTRANTAACA